MTDDNKVEELPLLHEPHVHLLPSQVGKMCSNSSKAYTEIRQWHYETTYAEFVRRDIVRTKYTDRIRRRLLNTVQTLIAERLRINDECRQAAANEWDTQRFSFLPKSLRRFEEAHGVKGELELVAPFKTMLAKIHAADDKDIRIVWRQWWKNRDLPFDGNYFIIYLTHKTTKSGNYLDLMYDYKYLNIVNRGNQMSPRYLKVSEDVQNFLDSLPASEFDSLAICAAAFPNNMLLISTATVGKMLSMEKQWNKIVSSHPRVNFPCIHFGSSHDS